MAPDEFSLSDLATECGISIHKADRLVRRLGLQPVRRVAYTRIFDREALDALREAVGRLNEAKKLAAIGPPG